MIKDIIDHFNRKNREKEIDIAIKRLKKIRLEIDRLDLLPDGPERKMLAEELFLKLKQETIELERNRKGWK